MRRVLILAATVAALVPCASPFSLSAPLLGRGLGTGGVSDRHAAMLGNGFGARGRARRAEDATPPSLSRAGRTGRGMVMAEIFTCDEVEAAANQCGMTISINNLGPYYRAVIRTLPKDGEEKGKPVGFTTGTMIGDLLRQDTMRVSSVNTGNELSRDRIKKLKAERDWRVPTVFGCSLVLGAYVMAIAREKGCNTAELLAIKDDDRQHAILVRHYKRLGLEIVKTVDDDISCTGDRLIWGGCGTLMRANVDEVMGKHTSTLKSMMAGGQP